MTFVDSNVLLDVFTDDPVWAAWSIAQLDAAAVRGAIVINSIVYAELSALRGIEDLEDVLDESTLALAEIPRAALFLAAKVFQRYRSGGDAALACCRTSSLAHMPQWQAYHC